MDLSWTNVLFAFGLTLFAGLSTGIGSVLALLTHRTNKTFLSIALGFSAGVMIYVSLVEIFFKAKESLVDVLGVRPGNWVTVASFFGGIFLIAVIDRLVPSGENPHESRIVEEMEPGHTHPHSHGKLMRMGMMSALAIAIHNFPEGMATFISALKNPSLGIAIAVAIAIHNIPEGIAVSVPIFYATGSRNKAFVYSFLSGVSEPVGALLGYLLLMSFLTPMVLAGTLAFVAGVMIYIALDELLPTAHRYGHGHLVIGGIVLGMLIMALSLLML